MGQYTFQLQYRLHKDGEADYIARSKPSYFMYRSVTTELDLEAGKYSVMIKITASRDKSRTTPQDIVKKTCQTRPEKLMAVGLSYDLAHAKGRLQESGLEHKNVVQRERREKRKLEAKKAFEAKRMADKKEKLRRLRLDTKHKAKKGKLPEGDQDTDKGIEVSIKVGEKTFKATTSEATSEAVGASNFALQEGTNQQLKITAEASEQAGSEKSGVKTTSGEIEQPGDKQAEDAVQVSEGTKDGSGNEPKVSENTDKKDVSAAESGLESGKESSMSTVGIIPTTSAESISATEAGNKTEDRSSPKSDDNAVAGGTVTDTKATTEKEGKGNESNAVEADEEFQNLTLDDISDDGLSWSSDIDVPLDSSSEDDSDSESDTDEPAIRPLTPPPSSENLEDDTANDPWNAVCVFGLLVYTKDSPVEIEVVRKQDDGESVESKKLDVDDQAADATKKLQKGKPKEEKKLETVGTEPAWNEKSKQG